MKLNMRMGKTAKFNNYINKTVEQWLITCLTKLNSQRLLIKDKLDYIKRITYYYSHSDLIKAALMKSHNTRERWEFGTGTIYPCTVKEDGADMRSRNNNKGLMSFSVFAFIPDVKDTFLDLSETFYELMMRGKEISSSDRLEGREEKAHITRNKERGLQAGLERAFLHKKCMFIQRSKARGSI